MTKFGPKYFKSPSPVWSKWLLMAIVYCLLKAVGDEASWFYSFKGNFWFDILYYYKAEIIIGLMAAKEMLGKKSLNDDANSSFNG